MDWRQVVAANLRRIRRERGFSQETLAYEAEINRTYISKLEKGSTWVGLEILVKLSTVLHVEPADFLQRTARRPAKKS
jgi:transcriptional regulator with XRE-family HTH domain